MYRRYEPMQRQNTGHPEAEQKTSPSAQQNKNNIPAPSKQIPNRNMGHNGNNSKNYNTYKPHSQAQQVKNLQTHHKGMENSFNKNRDRISHPVTKLIPESLYNPETGKILGFLSAEDLLIAALILLLIDNSCDDEDNSLLIYALLYILISDHIDLPF